MHPKSHLALAREKTRMLPLLLPQRRMQMEVKSQKKRNLESLATRTHHRVKGQRRMMVVRVLSLSI